MKKRCYSLLLVLLVTATGLAAQEPQEPQATLDINRLWLPKSYSQYWASLREIAETQLAQERCTEVVRGELARGDSHLEAPVFAVICRDQNRRTFVVKYDGITKLPIVPFEENAPEPEPEDQTEQVEVLAEDMRATLYQQCQARWLSDVALMKKLQWLDDINDTAAQTSSEIDVDDNPDTDTKVTEYTFIRRFNAQDAAGHELKYNANCVGSSLANTVTQVTIRRD